MALMLYLLIVVVLWSFVAVVDAQSALEAPWWSNSTADQVLLQQPSIARPPPPSKFPSSFSFLQKLYSLCHNDHPFPTRLPGTRRLSPVLRNPQQQSPNVDLLPHPTDNDPALRRVGPAHPRSPSPSFPAARNSPSLPSSTHRPLPPHWLLPPSSPPHALGITTIVGPLHVENKTTAELCHFPSAPRPRPSSIYCPSRVNLAPSCFDSDFPQSDSIKVVSTSSSFTGPTRRCSCQTLSVPWPILPFGAILLKTNWDSYVVEKSHDRFYPPTQMHVKAYFQFAHVYKYPNLCTKNGWSQIVTLKHTYQIV